LLAQVTLQKLDETCGVSSHLGLEVATARDTVWQLHSNLAHDSVALAQPLPLALMSLQHLLRSNRKRLRIEHY